MDLNEIAALIVGIGPEDEDELKTLASGLEKFVESDSVSERKKELAQEAVRAISSILSGESGDSTQIFDDLLLIIERMQEPDDVSPSGESEVGVSGEDEEIASPELIEEFISECTEHFQNIEQGLLELESDPEDAEALGKTFRAFHTIKGSAGWLGLSDIQSLSAKAEDLLECARSGQVKLAGVNADRAFQMTDLLKNAIFALNYGEELDKEDNPEEGLEACDRPDAEEEAVQPMESSASSEEESDEPKAESSPEAEDTPAEEDDETIPPDEVIDDPELLTEFINESLDHISQSESALLSLETNPEDMEAINAVFRAFHTMKGTSGFLGLNAIQRLAHRAENLLDRARNGEIRIVGGYADLALESADMLKNMISELKECPPGEPPLRPEGLMTLIEHLTEPEDHGVNECTGLEISGAPRVGDLLIAAGKITQSEVDEVARNARGKKLGEALIESGKVTAADVAHALRMQKKINDPVCRRDSGGSGSAIMQKRSAVQADVSVRVSTLRLDTLINTVGELVITQAMIAQNGYVTSDADRNLTRNVMRMNKITRELQDLSMSMRMVPLKGTFSKMARLVRDLARKSGKSVNFVTEGEDTEIDRNMVEALNDPLVHMVRNAVDHGIEQPDVRTAAGKPSGGRLVLRAYHAAGNVIIELQDDGKGLDKEKIIKKAADKGLIESKKDLSEAEIYKLIFAPGFSTADKVTDVSGRGVGMDVVKKNIESMRGRVEVNSAKGQGSTFQIRVPLTLAIIDGMLLQVGTEHYIVPTLNVNQAFRPEASALSTVQGRGEMVMLRGNLIPVFRLHRMFEVENAKEEPTDALLLVVEHEGRMAALLADELLGQQQVVIKSLGRGLGKIEGVSGAAILGDGRVGLILDIAGVLSIARGDSAIEAA